MTKKEIAIELAKSMKQIKKYIDIEATAKKLIKGMTQKEMEKALAHMRK